MGGEVTTVTRVTTLTNVERSAVELEVTLVEPHIAEVHLLAPGPGPRQALLLVLHHVESDGGQEVGQQEPQVAAAGAEVHHEVPRAGQLGEGDGQAGELPALPLQSVLGQRPGLGVDTGGQRGPVETGAVSQLHLLAAGETALIPPGQQLQQQSIKNIFENKKLDQNEKNVEKNH